MKVTTVGSDLAKQVFSVHGVDEHGKAVLRNAGRSVDGLRQWALALQQRTNHNKATCALANKLARICYACLRDGTPYGQVRRLEKKIARTASPIPA